MNGILIVQSCILKMSLIKYENDSADGQYYFYIHVEKS